MDGNRQVFFEARTKILPLEHAGKAVFPAELNDVRTRKFSQPLAVVAYLRLLLVQDLEHLFEISFRVRVHLFARQGRPRFGLARGVANHR